MLAVKLEPNVAGCSASCVMRSRSPEPSSAKGERWQRARALLSEMREAELEPNVTVPRRPERRRRAEITACEKDGAWQHALWLLDKLLQATMELTVAARSATFRALVEGIRRQAAACRPR
ncbi:unnamed protein product [Prorocentrum cordatum]|uniref:Uncharacterized protein n=1 Tax=Prorocentrum cordatum TaxID=2364126 RepID=A0ABN9VIB1_9DINO|nr:unnamed protein product [Polarella glacialis]